MQSSSEPYTKPNAELDKDRIAGLYTPISRT